MVPPEQPEAADPQEPKPTPAQPRQPAEPADRADAGDDRPTESLPAAEPPAPDGEPADEKPADEDSAEPQPSDAQPADEKPDDAPTETVPTETVPAVSPPVTRRSNVKMLIAIGLAVLVLAGGGVTIVALASRDTPEDIALQKSKTEARGVVERCAVLFGQARNEGPFALSKEDVKALLCAREQDALDQEWQDREFKDSTRSYAPTPTARLEMSIKDIQIRGDSGVATLTGTIADRKTDQDFELLKEDGQWKVCGVAFRIPRASGSGSASASSTTSSTETSSGGVPTGPTSPGTTTSDTTTTTETPS
jgi:hypothetical protein